MTRDDLNSNYDIIYDHRNLILELKKLVIDINGSRNDTTIYHTLYYYDEAGNRIRKMIYNNSNDSLLSDNIYSRDVSGRELAIYENGSIVQWNIYGIDNIGFIDGNEDIRFYMKDHLGSIRAEVPYVSESRSQRRMEPAPACSSVSENITIMPASKTRRLKEEHFEGFYLRVFESWRQTERFRTVCSAGGDFLEHQRQLEFFISLVF
jgi:hypothetical protein